MHAHEIRTLEPPFTAVHVQSWESVIVAVSVEKI
jgi:hypothetical protein